MGASKENGSIIDVVDTVDAQAGIGHHQHFLKGIKLEQSRETIFQAVLHNMRKGKTGIFRHARSLAVKLDRKWVCQVPDCEGVMELNHGLSKKYGTCREIIGSGGTGIVWVSHKRVSGAAEQLYAVKGFRQQSNGDEQDFRRRLMTEYHISSSLIHQNIIRALDLVHDEKGGLLEVMELCRGGDLHALLLERRRLEIGEADCFFKQMMHGVTYMHEMGIAHCDLKLENLVLTEQGIVKITDFGESERFRVDDFEVYMVGGACGSSPYTAPEVYINEHFEASAVDIWSAGLIYMAMRIGKFMWISANEEDGFYQEYVQDRRKDEGYGPIESLGKAECSNVVYSILDPKPGRRITAAQFLKTEWAMSIQLCEAVQQCF